MGYLDKTSITVDAILTKKGRELLSKGRSEFNITKFAVADDEIDYSLYDTAHPLGSNYYGSIIEALPVLEAVPDETQCLKYKLVSLNSSERGTTGPVLYIGSTVASEYSIPTLTYAPNSTGHIIIPDTQGATDTSYTLVLYNPDVARIVPQGNDASLSTTDSDPSTINNPVVAKGTQFTLYPLDVNSQSSTQITIFGNDTGVTDTFVVTINPEPTV